MTLPLVAAGGSLQLFAWIAEVISYPLVADADNFYLNMAEITYNL